MIAWVSKFAAPLCASDWPTGIISGNENLAAMGAPIPSEGNFQQRIGISENLGFFAFDRKNFLQIAQKLTAQICLNLFPAEIAEFSMLRRRAEAT
jgi:hypothetical protein